MPSYIGRNLRLSEAMRGLIEAAELRKSRRQQQTQDEFYRNLAEQRFKEDKKWREYVRKKEAEEAREPSVIGGQGTGYYIYRPGEQPGTGPYPQDQYEQLRQIIPPSGATMKPPAIRGFTPGTLYGHQAPSGEFMPQGQVPYKPDEEKERITFLQALRLAAKALGGDKIRINPETGELSMGEGFDIQSLYPKAESLYNMGNYGQWQKPGQETENPVLDTPEAQETENPVLDTPEAVEEWVRQHPEDSWLLQSPDYLEMKGQ